jgi:hypothetical protein
VQKFEDKLFEKSGWCLGDLLKKFPSNLLMDLLESGINSFVRRLLGRRHQGLGRKILDPTGSWSRVAGLLDDLPADLLSESLWMKCQKLSTALGYPPHAPCGRI